MKKLALGVVAALALIQAAYAAEGNWLTDLDKAQAKAKEEKKLVLMDFTGSDWCPPCKALHSKVLTSKEFVDFANENLILVMVDFPQQKKLPAEQTKANEELAKRFKIEGFPTIVVLDSNGKELSKDVGYSGESPKDFVAKLRKVKARS
ncbi:MAG: thioredoxin family protein [Verrucomicrobiia bacterium]